MLPLWDNGTIKSFPGEHLERSVRTPEIASLHWVLSGCSWLVGSVRDSVCTDSLSGIRIPGSTN